MSKLHKVSFYILDPNNEFRNANSLEDYLDYAIRYGFLEYVRVATTDIEEWDDDHPLNKVNCPEAEYEKYFTKEN